MRPYPYNSYFALLSQSGQDAPTATVFENSLNGEVGFSRISQGVYRGTLPGGFPVGRTAVMPAQSCDTVSDSRAQYFAQVSTNTNWFDLYVTYQGALSDDVMNNVPLEIRVYHP